MKRAYNVKSSDGLRTSMGPMYFNAYVLQCLCTSTHTFIMYFKEGLRCQCEQKRGPTYFNGNLHTTKRACYVKSRQGLFEQQ